MLKFKSKIKVAGKAIEYWGSQSISSDTSALFELVKNSRDADASRVEIIFEGTSRIGGSITVRDNGNGMAMEDVDEKWLVAGTDSKLVHSVSRGGRRVWGEMGIGRFACERLGKRTQMISFPRDLENKIVMNFDWEKYKEAGITFDAVTHDGYEEAKEIEAKHGLVLILENVKSKWSQAEIQDLKRELGSYILPSELQGSDDFEILISAPEYGIKNEAVQSTIIKISPLQMIASFDGGKLEVKISDRERPNGVSGTIFHERESKSYNDKTCGPFSFRLFFYPLDKEGEHKWEKYYEKYQMGSGIREFLRKRSGVYLYRDDVWVKPYGGRNDWLDLEGRRVQRRSRIGRSQVYGIVRIGKDKNPEIRPTAHREVLQSNQALNDLKSVVSGAITDLENYRQEIKTDGPKPPVEPGIMAEGNISQIIKMCKSKDALDQGDVTRVLAYAAAAKKHIAKSKSGLARKNEENKGIREHELNVMSLGLASSYVSHEIVRPLASMQNMIKGVKRTTGGGGPPKYDDWIEELEKNTNKLADFLSFINEYSLYMTRAKAAGAGASQVRVSDVWTAVTNGFRHLAGLTSFRYNEYPENLRIRINETDLESILTNLLTNSLESMRQKALQENNTIQCDVNYSKSGFGIKFSDNGTGIRMADKEKIFEPFITTSRTSDDVVCGHGLGLTIVREILEKYDGTIEVSSPGLLEAGTTFSISVPTKMARQVG